MTVDAPSRRVSSDALLFSVMATGYGDGAVETGLALDEGLARRMKALACTAPLHDLDARKARLDWADAETYQMAEVAFQVIDQVTVAMDFDHGARHDEVVARVLPFVAAQAPDRDRDEHAQVARWVLDNLINVGSTDRGFRAVYGAFGVTGSYERRAFDFKLLIELAAEDGGVYLRASDEAINVLVGALDSDIESAQIAAEIKLDNLIKRGKLSDAQAAAQQARSDRAIRGELASKAGGDPPGCPGRGLGARGAGPDRRRADPHR